MIRKPYLQILFTFLAIADSASVFAYNYSIVEIAAFEGQTTLPTAINNNGQITGYFYNSDSVSHAFLYSNGNMIDLSEDDGNLVTSYGYDLNDNGKVIGLIQNYGADSSSGFLYDKGVMTDLGSNVTPTAINSNGQIAVKNSIPGYSAGDTWGILNNGVTTSLGNIRSGGSVSDLNDSGQATGGSSYPYIDGSVYLYSNGNFLDLGTPTNGPGSIGNAINNQGEIVGASYTWVGSDRTNFYGVRAFVYSNGSSTILTSTLGGNDSYGMDINDNGDVVGSASINTLVWDPVNNPNPDHAFLYRNGTMTDLNSLIDPNAGWLLTGAFGINNSGWIIGRGIFNGQQRSFLATPVPLPSAGLFMLFGLGFLGSRIKQLNALRLNK